jgi:hypothetical protein
VGLGDLGEVAVGAAVNVRDGDDMAAGGQALENVGGGGTAAGEGKSVTGVLKGGDSSLEVAPVGVGGSRVLVLADGLADSSLSKGSGEGDGLNDGAGDGVVGRAGVHGKSAEAVNGGRGARRGLDDLGNNRGRHGSLLLCCVVCFASL